MLALMMNRPSERGYREQVLPADPSFRLSFSSVDLFYYVDYVRVGDARRLRR